MNHQELTAALLEIARAGHAATHGALGPTSGYEGGHYMIKSADYRKLCDALAALEALPQPEGQALTGPARAANMLKPDRPVPDWMRVLVFKEMEERLKLPSNDEGAIGPLDVLEHLNAVSRETARKEAAVKLVLSGDEMSAPSEIESLAAPRTKRFDSNTLYILTTDADGKLTTNMIRSCFDSAYDVHMMEGFLELESAKRLRNVPFLTHKLGALQLVDDRYLESLQTAVADISADGRRFRVMLAMTNVDDPVACEAANRMGQILEELDCKLDERLFVGIETMRKAIDQVVLEGWITDPTAPENIVNEALRIKQLQDQALKLAKRVNEIYIWRLKENTGCGYCNKQWPSDSLLERHSEACPVPQAQQIIENFGS